MMQNSQEQKRMPLIENRTLCLTILLMALVYNVIFGCVRNPLGEENTISWIGYDHPFAFLVWGRADRRRVFFEYFVFIPSLPLCG